MTKKEIKFMAELYFWTFIGLMVIGWMLTRS